MQTDLAVRACFAHTQPGTALWLCGRLCAMNSAPSTSVVTPSAGMPRLVKWLKALEPIAGSGDKHVAAAAVACRALVAVVKTLLAAKQSSVSGCLLACLLLLTDLLAPYPSLTSRCALCLPSRRYQGVMAALFDITRLWMLQWTTAVATDGAIGDDSGHWHRTHTALQSLMTYAFRAHKKAANTAAASAVCRLGRDYGSSLQQCLEDSSGGDGGGSSAVVEACSWHVLCTIRGATCDCSGDAAAAVTQCNVACQQLRRVVEDRQAGDYSVAWSQVCESIGWLHGLCRELPSDSSALAGPVHARCV